MVRKALSQFSAWENRSVQSQSALWTRASSLSLSRIPENDARACAREGILPAGTVQMGTLLEGMPRPGIPLAAQGIPGVSADHPLTSAPASLVTQGFQGGQVTGPCADVSRLSQSRVRAWRPWQEDPTGGPRRTLAGAPHPTRADCAIPPRDGPSAPREALSTGPAIPKLPGTYVRVGG